MRAIPATTLLVALLAGCNGSGDEYVPFTIDADNISTSEWPSKRSEVLAAAHEPTNSIMMFGGNDGPIVAQIPSARFRDDTWVFEPGTGWFEVTGEAPKARGRYAVSVDEDGGRALFFGGRFRKEGGSGDYKLFDDLWSFDFFTRTWTELDSGAGEAPDPRYYPASAWDHVTDTFYVWGGGTNKNPMVIDVARDLWAWDGSDWDKVETSGDKPSKRVFFGNTFDPVRRRIIVFGGQKGDFVSQAYNELYSLDLHDMTWTELHDGKGKAPSTRMHAHLEFDRDRDRYLLLGGHTDIGDMNDLWAFDPDTGEWEKEYIADEFDNTGLGCLGNPSEVPPDYVIQDLSAPERRHRGMFALMHDNLWLFGGIHAECSDQLDDTWRFDRTAGTWHELIEATSGESCARRIDDCECLCI